jgi:Flp pilus assembly protein TadD
MRLASKFLEVLALMRKLCSPALLVAFVMAVCAARADVRISIPKRTKPTPVQQLNRDGVRAVQKRDYAKAKRLFYKAYLIDPNDPFTLNNLGYIAELDGELDRAQRYYALAAELSSDATIDRASTKAVEGKAVAQVAGEAEDKGLQINRLNIEAMSLLQKDRAPEAELVLGRALELDRKNPYTLNNIGFMREQEGELDSALSYYRAAAATHADDAIVVAMKREWRGKPISEVADRNARDLERRVAQLREQPESEVALLNLRGVAALNRNDRQAARNYFQRAAKVAPDNAFTLNNLGYLAELDNDRETAQLYYDKARAAQSSSRQVGMATRAEFIGQQLANVASTGYDKVEARMASDLAAKRAAGGPVALKLRTGEQVNEPAEPVRRSALPARDVVQGDTIVVPPSPEEIAAARQAAAAPRTRAAAQQPAQPQPLQPQPLQPQVVPSQQQPATMQQQVPDIIQPIPPDPYNRQQPPQ